MNVGQPRGDACRNCQSVGQWTEDRHTGDAICLRCGVVGDRLIDDATDVPVFQDDDESRQRARIGATINLNSVFELATSDGSDRRLGPDDLDFLKKGKRNIDDTLSHIFSEDNHRISNRAKEVFEYGYRHQLAQKRGERTFDAGAKKGVQKRQKYARRKQIAVAAVFQALRELAGDLGLKRQYTISQISAFMDGLSDVNEKSVARVLNEIKDDLPPLTKTTDVTTGFEDALTSLPPVQLRSNDEYFVPFPRCKSCGGFGKDLLGDAGMCAHCVRLSQQGSGDLSAPATADGSLSHTRGHGPTGPAATSAQPAGPFSPNTLPRCSVCGGFGKDLVHANGKCAHCTRVILT